MTTKTKLIALVSIMAGTSVTRPGKPFEVGPDEAESLKKRQFARDPSKDELKVYWPANDEAGAEAAAKLKADADAKAAADAQAAAAAATAASAQSAAEAEAAEKAKAEAEAKAKAEGAAKAPAGKK